MVANLDTKGGKKRICTAETQLQIVRYTFKTTTIQKFNSLKGLKQHNTERHKKNLSLIHLKLEFPIDSKLPCCKGTCARF